MTYVRPYQRRKEYFGNGESTAPAMQEDPLDSEDLPRTLKGAVKGFAAHVRRTGAKLATRTHYETILLHDLDLPDGWPLTRRVLERWRDAQLELAEATQHARWNIVRQFVTWLMRQHELAGVPMADPMVDLPKPKRPKPMPALRTAADDELTALLRKCDKDDWWDHRIYVMIHVLRNTGLRVGEAVKLRWRNIAWDTPVLHEAQITLEPEEEGMSAQKSDTADDFAHMTDPAFSVLRSWHRRLTHHGHGGPDQWVFPVTQARGFIRDGRPIKFREGHWSTSHVWQMFTVMSIKARLKRAIYPHMLRHTAGTEFAVKTGDLEATRTFMRHADYAMVKAYLNPKVVREHMMAQHRKMAKEREERE